MFWPSRDLRYQKREKERYGRETLTLEEGAGSKANDYSLVVLQKKVWCLRTAILFKKKKKSWHSLQLMRVFSTVASCYDHWAVNFTIYPFFFYLVFTFNTLFLLVVLWFSLFAHRQERESEKNGVLVICKCIFNCCYLSFLISLFFICFLLLTSQQSKKKMIVSFHMFLNLVFFLCVSFFLSYLWLLSRHSLKLQCIFFAFQTF